MIIVMIGGPKDGMRVSVPDDNIPNEWVLPTLTNEETIDSNGLPIPVFKQKIYRLVSLRISYFEKARYVYLYTNLTTEDMFRILVDRYPQPLEEYMR